MSSSSKLDSKLIARWPEFKNRLNWFVEMANLDL
ncbi:hypothetical protein [Sporisorium scitamineum]|uniref:Uncharacterized protein n=1 Tax=Sporisorium scitamineum TaxID=49012 RepID=A0A0F7SAL4_9BASI|nr:hypothetical protein [Sporisorium scitamineum]